MALDIFLFLSLGLFSIGLVGVLLRRNALFLLMSVELMLNAVNLALVAFSRMHAATSAQAAATAHIAVMMIVAVAAAEAAVGIAIIVTFFRTSNGSADVDTLGELKG